MPPANILPQAYPTAAPAAATAPESPASPRKSIAIIGGGLSGLVTAKIAVQAGLFPTIFDRRTAVGGMWGDPGAVYDSLHTNVSRFTCSFSDFPWPPSSPEYPSAAEVGEYLEAYRRTFLADPGSCSLRLGCEVLRVAPEAPAPPGGCAPEAPPLPQHDGANGAVSPSWSVEWREVQHPPRSHSTDHPEFESQPQPGPQGPISCATPSIPPSASSASAWESAASATTTHKQRFDYVVVASGFCAVPKFPAIPGLESFPGLVLHSADYRGPGSLAGRRRVAVVGAGHSAADIAADLAAAAVAASCSATPEAAPEAPPREAGAAAAAVAAERTAVSMEVIHVTPRPFWVLPRYLPLNAGAPDSPFAPLDVVLHRVSTRPGGATAEEQVLPGREDHAKFNAFWSSLFGDQGSRLSPALAIPPDSTDPAVAAISDSYGPLVASGKLVVRRGRLVRVSGSKLELSEAEPDGGGGGGGEAAAAPPPSGLSDVDAIVLCTGLRPSLPFLSPEVLDVLSYTQYDSYVPLALHRRVMHPDLPGLGFVGVFRSPFFALMELQARLAVAAAAGTLPAPEADVAAQRAGVALELRVRQHVPRPAYPRQDFVGHVAGLAAALGILPATEWREEHDVVVAAHFAGVPAPALAPTASTSGLTGAAAAVTAAAIATASAAGTVEVARPDRGGAGPDAAEEAVRQALSDVAATLRRYRSGYRVASAVFQALAGEWVLRRRIVSRMASSPSGEVTGRTCFTTIADAGYTPAACGAGGLSYLYDEQGEFTIHGGAVMRVRREYVYSYDSTADRIDVYFAEGGCRRRGAFFLSLRFLPPGEPKPPITESDSAAGPQLAERVEKVGVASAATATTATAAAAAEETAVPEPKSPAGWRAVGEHLCGRDMYYASYRFTFEGIQLREFEIEFRVQGPNKDYTSTATYVRP